MDEHPAGDTPFRVEPVDPGTLVEVPLEQMVAGGSPRDAVRKEELLSDESWELLSQGSSDSPRCAAGPAPLLQPPATPEPAEQEVPESPAAPVHAAQQYLAQAGQQYPTHPGQQYPPQPAPQEGMPPPASIQMVAEEGPEEDPGSPLSAGGSHCTAHELYSLSQEGSFSSQSSHLTDELFAQGEPDPCPDFEASASASAEGPESPQSAAQRGLYRAIAQELSELTARARARAEAGGAAAAGASAQAWAVLRLWLESMQTRLGACALPPLRLLAEDLLEAGQALNLAFMRPARRLAKQLRQADWARLLLLYGCVALAALCYRERAANLKLAAKLAQRDAELAEVVGRILALRQRSSVPLIRPVNACTVLVPYGPQLMLGL